jgi:hypothetical protein
VALLSDMIGVLPDAAVVDLKFLKLWPSARIAAFAR